MSQSLVLPGRQIHLDFHTSPLIGDLLAEFDADRFASTLLQAHVNSVTLFAKCHHGMSYYPTSVGEIHPQLAGRDLLGEQIAALHRHGIRTPIYYTIGWEERLAASKPSWRQIKHDGAFANQVRASDNDTVRPGSWKFMCFNNPEYQDYIEAQLREILNNYPVDGFFLDIVFIHGDACFCDYCQPFRRRYGLLEPTHASHSRVQEIVKQQFAARMTNLIHSFHPRATAFYNSGHCFGVQADYSVRAMDAFNTHWEIESLPSGFWGYQHFPRFARHVATFGRPWIGMTGRFHGMWGDFGSYKPQKALEFECFRSQAHGGGISVGDQLPPRGKLDPLAYESIAAVFAEVEKAEPFYEGSKVLADVGIFLAGHPEIPAYTSKLAEEGAVLMLEESHYHPLILDERSSLNGFDTLVLPDTTIITDLMYDKLRDYHAAGGQLILSYRSGLDADGRWRLDFLPLMFDGEEDMAPTYWRTTPAFWPEACASDRVFYESGLRAQGGAGTEVLVERVLPYFKRTDAHFMSHLQSPPVRNADRFPAVISGEGFVYFADPVFAAYRRHGSGFHRDVVERVLYQRAGAPLVGAGLPRTVLCLPRRRFNDLIVTLLHYIPMRKALDIDTIEEASHFAGEVLRLRDLRPGITARCFGGNMLEQADDSTFMLPQAKGRLLIEVPDYFAER